MEVWKPIHSLNDKYEASNNGQIRNARTGRIMKQFTDRFGYKTMTVHPEKNVIATIRVHRGVAEAFLGERPNGYVVNHKDGNKANNNPENLEYVTSSQNNQHALDTGLRHPANMAMYAPRGENHYRSEISEEDVLKVLKLREETGYGGRKLAKMTGLSRGTVDAIIFGKSWKHITKSEKLTSGSSEK